MPERSDHVRCSGKTGSEPATGRPSRLTPTQRDKPIKQRPRRGEVSQKGTPRRVDSGEGQKPASKEVGFLVRDSSNVSGRRRTAAAVVVVARCRLAGNRRRREW